MKRCAGEAGAAIRNRECERLARWKRDIGEVRFEQHAISPQIGFCKNKTLGVCAMDYSYQDNFTSTQYVAFSHHENKAFVVQSFFYNHSRCEQIVV